MSLQTPEADADPSIEVFGLYVFQMGETFQSFDQVEERLRKHSEVNFVNYWRRDTRTVKGALMKTTRPIAARLKYYSIRYACVHGGQKFSRRGQGQRSKQTMRTGCPSYIMLRADKYGQQLEVIGVCNTHNHPISETDSQQLPQNRRLPPEVRADVLQMLHHRIDRKKIIEYVRHKCGKHVTSKDLFNLKANGSRSNETEETSSTSAVTRQELLNKIRTSIGEELAEQRDSELEDSSVLEQAPTVSIDLLGDMYYEIIEDNHMLPVELVDTPEEADDELHTSEIDMAEDPTMDSYVDYKTFTPDPPLPEGCDESTQMCKTEDQSFEVIIIEDTSNTIDEDEEHFDIEPTHDDPPEPEVDSQPEDEYTTDEAENSAPSSSAHSIRGGRKPTSVDFTRKLTRPRESGVRSNKNCKHCGLNAKLVRMQIAVLKAQKLKLDEETEILRLNKQRLLAEVQRYSGGSSRAIEQ